jgi:hypothetical protein
VYEKAKDPLESVVIEGNVVVGAPGTDSRIVGVITIFALAVWVSEARSTYPAIATGDPTIVLTLLGLSKLAGSKFVVRTSNPATGATGAPSA